MEIKQIIKELEASQEFKKWKKNNQSCKLTHLFNIIEGKVFGKWQVGYYNEKTDKITVFEMGDDIKIITEDDVFKDPESKVKIFELSKLKIELLEALETIYRFTKKKYPKVESSRLILIAQNLDIGQVWNVTLVSQSLDVLNIKLSTESGEILEHSLKPFFNFSKKDS